MVILTEGKFISKVVHLILTIILFHRKNRVAQWPNNLCLNKHALTTTGPEYGRGIRILRTAEPCCQPQSNKLTPEHMHGQ